MSDNVDDAKDLVETDNKRNKKNFKRVAFWNEKCTLFNENHL